jgi:hypothetical protein
MLYFDVLCAAYACACEPWRYEPDAEIPRAEVAELADALASGASGRKAMKVRVLSSAPLDSAASRAASWQATLSRLHQLSA